MKDTKVWIGLCAVVALSGCATGLVSSWKAPDAEPFQLRGVEGGGGGHGEAISRFASQAKMRSRVSCRARGAEGVPMYTLLAGAVPDEAKARAAAERAGVVGVVVLRPVSVDKEISSRPSYSGPMYGGFWGGYYGHGWGSAWSAAEIRTDTIIIVETLVYSLTQNKLVWAGQSKTTNPANLNRLIENTAKQVADELARQGLTTKS